eukprot:XP_011676979.1 PREDICTED: ATP-dependent DNA helicase Q4-like [Strongylocentrotus purpuratus]
MLCWVRTGVMVEFSELAFSFHCRGNLSDEELDGVVDFLHGRVMNLEKRELGQLDAIYSTLESVSKKSWMDCCDEVDIERSDHLRGELIKYFTEELDLSKMKRRQDDASKSDLRNTFITRSTSVICEFVESRGPCIHCSHM